MLKLTLPGYNDEHDRCEKNCAGEEEELPPVTVLETGNVPIGRDHGLVDESDVLLDHLAQAFVGQFD